MPTGLRIGIDVGGTFTDFVIYHPRTGLVDTFKILSTPENPEQAVLHGMARILKDGGPDSHLPAAQIVHGSTVATNALLQRRGAITALITTEGFRDILRIGRQNRPSLYDLFADPPEPLVADHLRLEVVERTDHTGRVIQDFDPGQVEPLLPILQHNHVESVAICLLFSFLNPEHEQRIARRLEREGFFVSVSSDILPEFREYERTSTTVVNAYLSPVLDRYLEKLETSLSGQGRHPLRLSIMQSNGGQISVQEARRSGVRGVLSGPAGGVVGAFYVAQHVLSTTESLPQDKISSSDQLSSRVRVITFDMGGTSTDVSLVDGYPQVTTESVVGGYPIRIPVLDIHTVGAGGGSIAAVDAGGALRVGPESAGSYPGPACYARVPLSQALPTVTDANLVLGRLDAKSFLGGKLSLNEEYAWSVLAVLGETLGMDPIRAAYGIIEVANSHMERALRLISLERGFDPRQFTLLSFGGAGSLHASDLARRLGIPRVIVPALASTLSAFGMLVADIIKDNTLTVMLPGDVSQAELDARIYPLVERGRQEVEAEGGSPLNILVERYLDLRYRGQSYELTVPFDGEFLQSFHQAHRQQYGYDRQAADVEIVNLRARTIGRLPHPTIPYSSAAGADPSAAYIEEKAVYLPGEDSRLPTRTMIKLYDGLLLRPGNILRGPSIAILPDTTILIGKSDKAEMDTYQNLILSIQAG